MKSVSAKRLAPAVLVAALLTGCAETLPEPKLADQTGKTLAEAAKTAEKAGYHIPEGYVADGTAKLLTFSDEVPLEGYESWTVCWATTDYVDVDDPFWVIEFHGVEKKSDCVDGKLDQGRAKAYKGMADEVNAAREEVEAEIDADYDDSDYDDSDGGGYEEPPLALDVAWLTLSDADRLRMCSMYNRDSTGAVAALIAVLSTTEHGNDITETQADTLFSTNC
ncbi:hypothetical protein OG336_16425 [[Kitasatospora] papulosa]|uniref:hypothetical protein n=1 Tax=[Kitasatospora] papulosa TaxID=1464011 RepID=UPI002E14C9E8|nr:hypothetical protein OG336_16425 [[Kitasatospora] papulosa]